jgi:hypothetical protein
VAELVNVSGPGDPTKPKCQDCGTLVGVHWCPLDGQIPGAAGAHRWLCGSCEYARDHEYAQRSIRSTRPKVPQLEELPFR